MYVYCVCRVLSGGGLCVIKKPRCTRRQQPALGCRARETNKRVWVMLDMSRPALGCAKPPILWVPGTLSPRVRRAMHETDESSIMLRLRTSRAVPLPFIILFTKTKIYHTGSIPETW
jgi:hypothetical protein